MGKAKKKTQPTIRFDIYMAGDIATAKQVCREFCFKVGLCVHIEAADFIYMGGEESGFKVGLVNYPRFPTTRVALHAKAKQLAAMLQRRLCQHSALIVGAHATEWIATVQIDATDERLRGAVIVASVSGGKDSAAMSLALTAAGLPHRRVFADTGWEHPWTYAYLRGPLTAAIGTIDEVQSERGGMQEWIRHKGMLPSRTKRWCTEKLKVKPILAYIEALRDAGHNVVNAVGLRAGESEARSKLTPWEWSDAFDCWVWRPLLTWTEQEVIDTHAAHNLRPNPLYLAGAARVGCWPCIFASKPEIALVAKLSPERIAEIGALEAETTATARERGTPEKFLPRTYFNGHAKDGGMKPWPIAQVAEWSTTARGGHQQMLFNTEPQGCMRWGLCESNDE